MSNIIFEGIGFDINMANDESTIVEYGLEISGAAKDFIIVNNIFKKFAGGGIKFHPHGGTREGHPVGVVTKNRFESIYYRNNASNSARGYGVAVYGPCTGTDNYPCSNWAEKFNPGSNNAVFIEDNYFTKNRHSVSGHMGGHFVFRYNEIKDNYYPYSAIDAHGERESDGYRSTRLYEVYHNIIDGGVELNGTPHGTWAMGFRGGDGVVFNNDIKNTSNTIMASIERTYGQIDDLINMDPYPAIVGRIEELYFWGNTTDTEPLNTIKFGWSNEQKYIDFIKHYINDSIHFKVPKTKDWSLNYDYQPFTYPHPLRDAS